MGDSVLLNVKGLKKHFPIRGGVWGHVHGYVHAVEDVSFSLRRGESLGLVGESGSGKTTVGRAVLRLIEPTAGQVRFDGEDVLAMDAVALRRQRRRMQIVFQDPASSMNSRMTVESIVGEGLKLHKLASSRRELRQRVGELLEQVGLPQSCATRYPHEFSGGQRQRICIARALSVRPEFIVADEPVSALDVSIQAQILNLLKELQKQYSLSYLFIAHNLAVVQNFCDHVAVMYLGRIVEQAPSAELYRSPKHPYTQALLDAVPIPDPTARRERAPIEGDPPSPIDPPAGCAFHPRCPYAMDRCRCETPTLTSCGENHFVACWKKQ